MREYLSEIVSAQQPQIFLWLPVAFGCGVAAYFGLPAEPGAPVVGGLVLAGVLIAVALATASRGSRTMLLLALAPVIGFLDADWRANRVSAPVLAAPFYGAVEGTIVGIDRSASNAPRIVLSDVSLTGIARGRTPRRVRISLMGWVAPDALRPGQRVAVTASLSPPGAPVEPGGFDFRRLAWFKRIGAVGYTRHPLLAAGLVDRSVRVFRLRMLVADAIRARIPGQNGAFAAAILTGDRSAIDPAITTTLRSSNLAHLLAISGLHMGLLTGFVFTLVRYGLALIPALALRVQTKKLGAIAALSAGLGYLVLSGANVATQRAFVMAAVVLLAVLCDRPAFTLRAVALAALVVLFWRPESLMGAGFQMSFAATTALVATFEWLRNQSWWRIAGSWRRRFLRPVLMLLISSSVAGAATAPFAAFHFNQIVPYGLAANLTAVPLMGMVVMPSAVVSFLLWPFGLEGFALGIMGQGIAVILDIASTVASLPGAVRKIATGGPWTLPLLTLGGLFFLLWQGRGRLVGLAMVTTGFVYWTGSDRPDVLISDGARLVGFSTAQGRVLTRKRGEGFAARIWLENDGDAASQTQAWARQKLKSADGGLRAELANGWRMLVVNEAQETGSWRAECRARVVILAVSSDASPVGDCLFIGKKDVRQLGSMSLHLDAETSRLIGAMDPAATRLWSKSRQ